MTASSGLHSNSCDHGPQSLSCRKRSYPVIAIGASAGGLEAIRVLLALVPETLHAALVVVTHLPADKESHLHEVLATGSNLPVISIEDDMPLEPGTVFCAPAGHDLSLEGGHLRLLPPGLDPAYRIIDRFFDSLAREQGARAACVILSGAGSDGTRGALHVSRSGGLVLVQEPASAMQSSMPLSVISAGAADAVLPLDELALRLANWVRADVTAEPEDENLVRSILEVLHRQTGHDLTGYRTSTIARRIGKRRLITRHANLAAYLDEIEANPTERAALFTSLFIGVTSFFRDSGAFALLLDRVLPTLLDDRPENMPLRIWVAGCSTGEEAYSIAMLVEEFQEQSGRSVDVKIFASDIDEEAVEIARKGAYSERDVQNVDKGRLARFFRMTGRDWTVHSSLTRA